tara:strand:+ start:934 stop:1464 length:531 start_codon:yes stop_codon:yes gene_type:complete
MNLKNQLEMMNISDLRYICRELRISCPEKKSSIINKLLVPLTNKYRMNSKGKGKTSFMNCAMKPGNFIEHPIFGEIRILKKITTRDGQNKYDVLITPSIKNSLTTPPILHRLESLEEKNWKNEEKKIIQAIEVEKKELKKIQAKKLTPAAIMEQKEIDRLIRDIEDLSNKNLTNKK